MTKRLLFLCMLLLLGWESKAQEDEKRGSYYYDAIPIVLNSTLTEFTDVRNTEMAWYSSFIYQPDGSTEYKRTGGNAVFYRMENPVNRDVIVHNWNSRLGFSTIFVYRILSEPVQGSRVDIETVAVFEVMDFLKPGFNPEELGIPPTASPGLAYLHLKNLPPGSYFIVTAGYRYMNGSRPNGELGITVWAESPHGIPEEPAVKPERPNTCRIQFNYDLSGNRNKTIQRP